MWRVDCNKNKGKEPGWEAVVIVYLKDNCGLPARMNGFNYFIIHVNQTIMLYTLNLYSDVWQLFLNKTGKKDFLKRVIPLQHTELST